MRFLLCFAVGISAVTNCCAQNTASRSDAVIPEKVMAARLLNVVAPTLPDGAIGKRCSNALVMLKVTVDERGNVSSVDLSSGYNSLKDSALAAVKQWTYKPYEEHGHPIAVQTRVSIFYLGNGQTFPVFAPDGKGGVKGGNTIPLPPGCGPEILVKRAP